MKDTASRILGKINMFVFLKIITLNVLIFSEILVVLRFDARFSLQHNAILGIKEQQFRVEFQSFSVFLRYFIDQGHIKEIFYFRCIHLVSTLETLEGFHVLLRKQN